MLDVDVVILGAGPAGAAAGLTLTPKHRILMLDRRAQPEQRIGESLIPAARRLLRDMKILDAFELEGHEAYLGNRSIWGGQIQETDFLRDPDGPGWHLDRAKFERFLRAAAVHRGARLIAPSVIRVVQRTGEHWQLEIDCNGAIQSVKARFLIDAGGRKAPLACRLGASQVETDRLIACWIRGDADRTDSATAGFSMVESELDGWWYAATIPDTLKKPGWVLAFHMDSDLVPVWSRERESLLARVHQLPGIGRALRQTGFRPVGKIHRTAAGSQYLSPPVGPGWLAIGDAALCFDPLASRGLFNALYSALTGAMLCHDYLDSGINPGDYEADLNRIRTEYTRQAALIYSAESRWPDHPFWARRSDTVTNGEFATSSQRAPTSR